MKLKRLNLDRKAPCLGKRMVLKHCIHKFKEPVQIRFLAFNFNNEPIGLNLNPLDQVMLFSDSSGCTYHDVRMPLAWVL
ncbi:hypothetical protein P7K49_029047 [Saguinus oedipus]|uniref:Uncharacterized protein n=1 Tax=Saguinus oedipus TaxID=9490 RepID=A0ABQ9U635_SAGOE|nr:hypothetical protein P7K49_029047 [Saguinus oedipus]